MNNLLKKQKNVSISVIRALNRINGYIEKEAVPLQNFWQDNKNMLI